MFVRMFDDIKNPKAITRPSVFYSIYGDPIEY